MIPPEIVVFLIAMSPIIELRGAIPIALKIYHLPLWSAYLFSVLGNLVPLILIILFLDPVSRFFSEKSHLLKKFIDWIFIRVRRKSQTRIKNLGEDLAVIALIATPIPFVGGWTGAILAFIFGMSFKRALPLVITGAFLAGAIVVILTLGISSFLK
ncbi:MAG: small multi-drug export protein [Candidatus Parcubacteria bacterium]|nr:small multi-drug export protein [Candidatus Parcubacteria bacterium]